MQGQIEYQKKSENSENLTFEISFFIVSQCLVQSEVKT